MRATGAPFASVLALRRAAAGVLALHRLRDLPARLEPAQLDDGRHRRRRRHRRHAVRRVPALRLRLRLRDPDLDHRAHHGRRGPRDRRCARSSSTTRRSRDLFRRGGRAARERTSRTTDGTHAAAAAPSARVWRRFTPAQRLTRFVVYLVIVAAIVVSVADRRGDPGVPVRRAGADGRPLRAHVADRLGALPGQRCTTALMETIHIATLGTLLALRAGAAGRRARRAQPRAVHAGQPAREADPGVVALGQLAGVGAAVRRHLRPRRARRHARDRVPLDRLRRQALRRGAGGGAAAARSRR